MIILILIGENLNNGSIVPQRTIVSDMII